MSLVSRARPAIRAVHYEPRRAGLHYRWWWGGGGAAGIEKMKNSLTKFIGQDGRIGRARPAEGGGVRLLPANGLVANCSQRSEPLLCGQTVAVSDNPHLSDVSLCGRSLPVSTVWREMRSQDAPDRFRPRRLVRLASRPGIQGAQEVWNKRQMNVGRVRPRPTAQSFFRSGNC